MQRYNNKQNHNVMDDVQNNNDQMVQIEADIVFKRWKDGNKDLERDIERFMSNGRAEHAAKIMEASDRLRVIDGGRVERIPDGQPSNNGKSDESEEIRLLREQNDLLKQLLNLK